MDQLNSILDKFLQLLMTVLPLSPFQQFLEEFKNMPYMGFVNWFIPIGACIKVVAAWLTAIAVFYMYMIIMRWVKLIGD